MKIKSLLLAALAMVALAACDSKDDSVAVDPEEIAPETRAGFLSEWETPEEHMANADDDEQAAWLWFHDTYPECDFVPFSSITSTGALAKYAVLFWLRDVSTGYDDVYNFSKVSTTAAKFIGEWTKNGGSMLLWQHAVPYIGCVGRFPQDQFAGGPDAIGAGVGGMNPDTWSMAVNSVIESGKVVIDHSTHPLYKGLEDLMEPYNNGSKVKVLPVKGPGYSEDHNCGFFDRPSWWTEQPNDLKECYDRLVDEFGVTPLGTWDSQAAWISMLSVWEAGPAKNPSPKFANDYKGTFLCIGNGGLEFAMNNPDGTADNTMSVNKYQKVTLTIANNAIEYLLEVQQTGL